MVKNADVNRTHGICHVIHIFFGSSSGKVQLKFQLKAKFHHCRICLTDFRIDVGFADPSPTVSQSEKAHPEQG